MDNIGICLEKILDEDLDCIHMAHDQVYCGHGHGNEISCFMKGEVFLGFLRNY